MLAVQRFQSADEHYGISLKFCSCRETSEVGIAREPIISYFSNEMAPWQVQVQLEWSTTDDLLLVLVERTNTVFSNQKGEYRHFDPCATGSYTLRVCLAKGLPISLSEKGPGPIHLYLNHQ